MPKGDREAFYDHLKNTTNDLLDDAETTVEKVEHYMDEIKVKGENEWIEKLYILKKCLPIFMELREDIFFRNNTFYQ